MAQGLVGVGLVVGLPAITLMTLTIIAQSQSAPQYRFCPKPDITAYEVALALKFSRYFTADTLSRHPEMQRHISVEPCNE